MSAVSEPSRIRTTSRAKTISRRLDPKVEARPSTIPGAGMGLFCKVALIQGRRRQRLGKSAGEVIATYTGKLIDMDKGQKPVSQAYAFRVNSHLLVDATDPNTPGMARYTNEPRDGDVNPDGTPVRPNAYFAIDTLTVPITVRLRARKTIRLGEEIFVHYNRGSRATIKGPA
jgi:hypothetical protein